MKLAQLSQPLSSCSNEAPVCEACNRPFSCGAQLSGCWCSEVKLSDATRSELRQRYQSCLCRTCLERFAENEKENLALPQEALTTSPLENEFGTPH